MRFVLVLFLLAACAGGATLRGDSALADGASDPGFLGRYIWREDVAGFGEFSGLHMTDGRNFLTVTDNGMIAQGNLRRDSAGRIVGVDLATFEPLRDADGQRLRNQMADAESVVRAPDGRIYVSFERRHRVLVYDAPGGPGRPLPPHPDFAALRDNLGLEAMAMDSAGTLYAIPEMPPRGWAQSDHPVYRYRNGAWDSDLRITRDSLYLPVGAAFGPDGRLYLLERNFLPGLGFRSRVRRFSVGPAEITGGTVVIETPRGRYGNLEGLAVWRDAQGALVLTMIADDNRNPSMPTEWVEYRLGR